MANNAPEAGKMDSPRIDHELCPDCGHTLLDHTRTLRHGGESDPFICEQCGCEKRADLNRVGVKGALHSATPAVVSRECAPDWRELSRDRPSKSGLYFVAWNDLMLFPATYDFGADQWTGGEPDGEGILTGMTHWAPAPLTPFGKSLASALSPSASKGDTE